MSEWKPQIVKIQKVQRHPNADNLDIVTVLGDYHVITKRDEYKRSDLSCYLPIDTIVPDTEQFYFLCPRNKESNEVFRYPLGSVPEKYRIIKVKKILSVCSQGMLVPFIRGMKEGDSIVDALNLKKWEEEEEDNIPTINYSSAVTDSPPDNWKIPYYDLESVRKYISCVENEKDIILSEKLNGSNFSACFDGTKLFVKSRNFYKKLSPNDMWGELAIRYDLENKLSKYPMIVLFGECVNQIKKFNYTNNIQNGKTLTKLYCFDAFDVKKMRFLDYDDFSAMVEDLGLEKPPVLYRGPWTDKNDMYSYAEGMSTINPKIIREGWVLSLGKERYEPQLNGRLKLKLISEQYNLSK